MYYLDSDPIGKPHMIHRQTSYDSAVLTEDTGVIQGLPTDGYMKSREKTDQQANN